MEYELQGRNKKEKCTQISEPKIERKKNPFPKNVLS